MLTLNLSEYGGNRAGRPCFPRKKKTAARSDRRAHAPIGREWPRKDGLVDFDLYLAEACKAFLRLALFHFDNTDAAAVLPRQLLAAFDVLGLRRRAKKVGHFLLRHSVLDLVPVGLGDLGVSTAALGAARRAGAFLLAAAREHQRHGENHHQCGNRSQPAWHELPPRSKTTGSVQSTREPRRPCPRTECAGRRGPVASPSSGRRAPASSPGAGPCGRPTRAACRRDRPRSAGFRRATGRWRASAA